MTDQVEKNSPFMDLLIEVDEHHKKGVGNSGKGLIGLSAGDQRRCFNEGIKNYGDEGKTIHNKFDAEFLKKCSAAGELEALGKGLTFPIDEKKLEEINKIFEKIDLELTSDPRWDSFWKNQQKANPNLSDSDLEKIKSAILSGFRFKVIQMVGFNVMKTNPSVMNNYSSLMQTINGVKLKQATGEIDIAKPLPEALAIHISQGEYANKINAQDYLAHAEGKISSMPNDKKIAPIFGKELADKAFNLAMQSKKNDRSFLEISRDEAIKNKNSDEVKKFNRELERVTALQTRQSGNLAQIRNNNNRDITEVPVWRRIGKAIGALFKYGLDFQAIRAAYFAGPGARAGLSSVTTQVTEMRGPNSPSTELPSKPLLNRLSSLTQGSKTPTNSSGTERLGPPYTPLERQVDDQQKTSGPDSSEKLRSSMFHFLRKVEIPGQELSHIRQQVGQAGINIASGAEPKQVIENLERSISMVKEEFGVKNPESVKCLDDLGKKLNEFKERSNKINVTPSEPEQKSTVKSTVTSKHL